MKFPKIDAYHLIVFYFVAKEKSITLAADDLCLTQPTVTRHIKSLENTTNLKLIEVNKQRVSLTPSGEALYQYAKEIYQQTINAGRFVELSNGSSIKIGVSPFFNCILAPVLISMFDDLYPSTKISVENECTFDLVRDVWHSKIDLAIVPGLDYGNLKLDYVRISDEVRLIFYASPANSIFEKHPIRWKDLYNYPLLIGEEGSASNHLVKNRLKSEGLDQLRIGPAIITDIGLRKKLVQNGEFISLTLPSNIEDELCNGTLRVIPLPDDVFIEVGIVIRQNIVVPSRIQKFISLTREAFKSAANKSSNQNFLVKLAHP